MKRKDEFKKRWVNCISDFLKDKTDEELHILFLNFETHAEKRRDILYDKHIDGQTSLYDPLLEVFEKLGVEADEDAYGIFSSAVFDWRGYGMELYCGQGSFYSLSKT